MNEFFVTVYHGNKNSSNFTLYAEDNFEAAFFACCNLERCGQMKNLGPRPLLRYNARKNEYYVNGVPVTVVQRINL